MAKILPSRLSRSIAAVLCSGLFALVAGFCLNLNANELNHGTMVTFTDSVEVPGAHGPIVLSPGTYVFEATNPLGSHAVVQIFNKDKTHLYATILAIRTHRATPSGTVITLVQKPGEQAQQLKTWFYRDAGYGQEFVYTPAND